MNVNDVLGEVFETHDKLSHESVFNPDRDERDRAFNMAEGVRLVIENVEGLIKDPVEQKRFSDAKRQHFESYGKGLFYRRQLTFSD